MRNLAVLVGIGVASLSQAVFFDLEPNGSLVGAQDLVRPLGIFSDVGLMSLTAGGDVDVVRVRLYAGESFTAVTTPTSDSQFSNPDTRIAILDFLGTPLVEDDDSGPGLGSLAQINIFQTGTYYIAVAGFDDPLFQGTSSVQGNYTLTVSAVPEPASFMALGLGALSLLRRRRAA